MKLSAHFSLDEFTQSNTAERLNIDNSLPPELLQTAQNTADMMERIRLALGGKPILITSGYRCPDLNKAIGSGPGSDHPKAMAVDFKCPEFGTPYEVARFLAQQMTGLGIGQLIYEQTWVHVSTRHPDKAVNTILTMRKGAYSPGINP